MDISDESNDDSNNIIKVILVGDSGTGKTNLITVSAGFPFNSNMLSTTSCSYVQKIIKKNDKEYKLNLWDTIGQERYRSLTKIFLKGSKIVIFVYDISNKKSFQSLEFWKKIIDDIVGSELVYGIVGNKIDLYDKEEVNEDEAEAYAKKIGAKYLLTSAKTDSQSFIKFIEEISYDYIRKNYREERIESIVIKKGHKKKHTGCC